MYEGKLSLSLDMNFTPISAIDTILYRGPKNVRPRTYEIMKKKGDRVVKQLYRLLSSDYCDRYASFDNQETFGKNSR